jgi:glycosyltransferase involved in cell wall biosynthesis
MLTTAEQPNIQEIKRSMVPSLSILICTYNPEAQIFQRVLKSIESLKIPDGIFVEGIIVDNNSKIPVDTLPYVQDHLEKCPWIRVIQEPQQGLGFARLKGIEKASGSTILFIDTDNEVAPDYLEAVCTFLQQYPHVAAVGPGHISVDFLGEVSEWFKNNFRAVFQEKHTDSVAYACIPAAWLDCYPIGTGLVIRKEVFEHYYSAFQNGTLTAVGRTGKSMTSGDDIQIIWQTIKAGYAVGVCPDMKVSHLIPESRANMEYVTRLHFGTSASYIPALVECFPQERQHLLTSIPSTLKIIYRVTRITIKQILHRNFRRTPFELAGYLGGVSGHYHTAEKNNPIADFIIKQLNLR